MSFLQSVDIDPRRHAPLHRQVSQALAGLIDAGKLAGPLPAPNQLARELRVFSGSIRRAYDELVEVGVLKVDKFRYAVADQNPGKSKAA